MLIQMTDILSVPDKVVQMPVLLEAPGVVYQDTLYEFLQKPPIVFTITNHGKKRVSVVGKAEYILSVPCSRCLEPVKVPLTVQINRELEFDQEKQEEYREEAEYVDGYSLDAERMIMEELLLGVPVKVLCRDTCKGICSMCGKNLNEGACGCVSEPKDPRMAAISDIFKNFKEV